MTRLEAVKWQDKLFPNEMLPEICCLLRSGVNGSADEWDKKDVVEACAMLKARLDTWQNSFTEKEFDFDESVRAMVIATLVYVSKYTGYLEIN